MITSGKTRPSATSVPVVNVVTPTSHIWSTSTQVWTPTTLTEVEGILPEKTMAVDDSMTWGFPTCLCNGPSVSSVSTSVPEKHARMATVLKHLKSDEVPSSADTPSGFTIAPTV
jgi:hypothetical protein